MILRTSLSSYVCIYAVTLRNMLSQLIMSSTAHAHGKVYHIQLRSAISRQPGSYAQMQILHCCQAMQQQSALECRRYLTCLRVRRHRSSRTAGEYIAGLAADRERRAESETARLLYLLTIRLSVGNRDWLRCNRELMRDWAVILPLICMYYVSDVQLIKVAT